MAALSKDVQAFIVQSLARFLRPSQVVAAVKTEFDITLDRRQVQYYHPERGEKGRRISKEWKILFEKTREDYINAYDVAPIELQPYRFHTMQRVLERAEDNGNDVLVLQTLEHAAKEKGGAHTNKQKHSVDITGELVTMSVEEWKRQDAERLKQAEAKLAELAELADTEGDELA